MSASDVLYFIYIYIYTRRIPTFCISIQPSGSRSWAERVTAVFQVPIYI